MKLDTRVRGSISEVLEVRGDVRGLCELREAITSALAGSVMHGEPYRVDRAPEGLGRGLAVEVVP